MNLEDILKLGLAAYSASQGDAAGAASGLTGIFGPIFGSGSQPAGGIGGKSSGDFLSSIFESSSPTGESPTSQGGFLDSLGNIFGTGQGSPTGYTGPSVLPGVLGGLASSFRATPRAGATRKERDKANQYNMIAGILGALATGYGKASDEAAKQKATSELYQIFSGAQPTAVPAADGAEAAPVQSRSERLNKFIRNNPAMASAATKLLGEEKELEQKLLIEQWKAAQKAGGRVYDMPTAINMAANMVSDKSQIIPVAQGLVEQSKIDKANAVQSAISQISSPTSSAKGGFAPIPSNLSPAEQETARALTGYGAIAEPTPTTPVPSQAPKPSSYLDTLQETLVKQQEETQQREQRQEQRLKTREELQQEDRFDRVKKDYAEPYKSVLNRGAEAEGEYKLIKGDLSQGTFLGTRRAIKKLENMVDGSVVHQYEMKDTASSILSDLDNLKLRINRITNRNADVPLEAKKAILEVAKRAYDINTQSQLMARSAIDKATNDRVVNKNRFATVEQFLPNEEGFTTIAKLRAALRQKSQQPQPMLSPSPTPSSGPVPFNRNTGIF